MNRQHLKLCSSDEWADAIRQWIIPWGLEAVELGDDVLELGPGFGLTTDVLRTRVARLTSVEIDEGLAGALSARLKSTNVEVICADATKTGMPDERFTAAVCLTMLHHVPSAELQDLLFTEAFRLLRPGGIFAGQDELDSPEFRAFHFDDVCVPVPPAGLQMRLETCGFEGVFVEVNEYAVRFRVVKPVSRSSRHDR